MIKLMGHTAVSDIQASSVTRKNGNMAPKKITVILQLSTGQSIKKTRVVLFVLCLGV